MSKILIAGAGGAPSENVIKSLYDERKKKLLLEWAVNPQI